MISKKLARRLVVFVLSFSFPASAWAATSPWRILGGIGLGIGGVSSPEFMGTATGPQYFLSGLVSRETQRWVADGGASWTRSSLSGKTSVGTPVRIVTRAGMANLGLRYRLSDKWQLGPQVDISFGTDTSYRPSVGAPSRNIWVGLRGVYGWNWGKLPARWFVQASVDTSISGLQSKLVMTGIQIGIPTGSKKNEESLVSSRSAPSSEVRVTLDPRVVFFDTNSAALRARVRDALSELGDSLTGPVPLSGKVRIEGHADQRGSYEYNLRLSEKRARSIENALRKGGAEDERLAVQAFSFSRPSDEAMKPEAWRRNRRVELIFSEVRDVDSLMKKLKPLTALRSPAGTEKESRP